MDKQETTIPPTGIKGYSDATGGEKKSGGTPLSVGTPPSSKSEGERESFIPPGVLKLEKGKVAMPGGSNALSRLDGVPPPREDGPSPGNRWYKGMPSPNPSGLPPTNPMRRAIQIFLESADPADPETPTRMQKMIKRIYEISLGGGRDAVNAFQALSVYGYGRAAPSPEELKAMEGVGLRIIVLPALPPKDASPPPKALPEFEDAEFEDIDGKD